jgi:branched-chain amino acid transport system permease protein
MDRFFEYFFTGLSIGSLYALVALGLVVIFRATGHLNFAQGEMATLSAFIVWALNDSGLPLLVATILGMVFGFVFSAATEVAIIRPLTKKSPLAVLVALIALFLGINAFTSGKWGALPQEQIGSLFPKKPGDFWRIFGTVWRYEYIGILVVTLVLTGLLFLLFKRTRFGLAMRAVASNAESSKLVGVSTGLVLAVSWGIAGALGALAGVLNAGIQGSVTPGLMFTVFVYAAASATLGGLDSPGGAVIAGLMIGVFENMAAGYFPGWIGQEMKLSVALIAIFVVLLVKPSGLFGTAKIERV